MMKISSAPGWVITCAVLVLAGVFFAVCMRGYRYITLTLLFIAVLITVSHIAPRPVRNAVFALTAAGLAYFCFVEALVISDARGDSDPERDYIVVLGAAVHGDTPSLSLLHRLQKTEEYLNACPDSIAVVTGGQGTGENISEGECMRRWLISRGIAEDRVIAETRSVSTMENLIFAKEIIEGRGGDARSIAVLSSPYHLYRAKRLAKSLGIDAAGVACVHGYPVYSVGMYIREAFGVTHMWAFGN